MLDGKPDAAAIGELHGVASEICQRLAQAQNVAKHQPGDFRGDMGCDFETLALGGRRQQLRDLLDETAEIERLLDEFEAAGFNLGEVENLINQAGERGARSADRFDVARRLGIEPRVAQQLGHAENAVQRRADLVAHRGQESRFGFARGFGAITRLSGFLEPPDLVAEAFVVDLDRQYAGFRAAPAADRLDPERGDQREQGPGLDRQLAQFERDLGQREIEHAQRLENDRVTKPGG